MAFDLMKMLGLKSKKPDLGPIMNAPLPPSTIGTTPIGKDVLARIMAMMSEGYGPSYVSSTTSPLAEQMRSTLAKQTIPNIEQAASARGLGRSTIVPRDIGEATAQTGRDINQVIANAIAQNEQAKMNATQLGLGAAGQEAGLQTGVSSELSRRAGIDVGAQQAADAGSAQNLNKIIATAFGLTFAPQDVPGIWSGGGTSGGDSSDLLNYLKSGSSSPFIGTNIKDLFGRVSSAIRGPEMIGSQMGYRMY